MHASPQHAALHRLTADQCEAFHRDGFLHVRSLIAPERLAAARDALAATAETMLAQLAREGLVRLEDLPRTFERRFAGAGDLVERFGRGWRKEAASPGIFDLHQDEGIVGAVQDLLGDANIGGHSVYNIRPKLPHQQLTVVPWHQDSAYFGAESVQQQILTAWVPLVPVTTHNGALQVVRGSHRTALQPHRTEDRKGAFLEIDGPDPDPALVVDVPMEPGDCLFFGNLLWHRSVPNASDGIRWSIDLRYYGLSQPGRAGADEFPEPWVVRAADKPATSYAQWRAWVLANRY